ncbi:hypothetical protein IJJ08_01500 [bacterium]|nr:hypothetical protein [bacterium]
MQTFDLRVRLGGHEYLGRFEDNPTTRKLKSGCPWRLELADQDRLAKFCLLEGVKLPTDARRPEQITPGQFYLYEDNCLVLFYQPARTSYRYTYLGELLDPAKLIDYIGYHQTTLELAST